MRTKPEAKYEQIGEWYVISRQEFEKASKMVKLTAVEMRGAGYGVREIARVLRVQHSYVIQITNGLASPAHLRRSAAVENTGYSVAQHDGES